MKTAKLFKNGLSQAVRLPKEFRFKGKEVIVKKVGDAVILLPLENCWTSLIESLPKFSEDFMSQRDQGAHQEREGLFDE